jgi:hypothetical protein
MFGADIATEIAIKASMIAYSTMVTPFAFFFLFKHSSMNDSPFSGGRLHTHWHYVTSFRPNLKRAKVPLATRDFVTNRRMVEHAQASHLRRIAGFKDKA